MFVSPVSTLFLKLLPFLLSLKFFRNLQSIPYSYSHACSIMAAYRILCLLSLSLIVIASCNLNAPTILWLHNSICVETVLPSFFCSSTFLSQRRKSLLGIAKETTGRMWVLELLLHKWQLFALLTVINVCSRLFVQLPVSLCKYSTSGHLAQYS